ncbi:MAG: TRAP transporter large permease subunit [Burkholderiaceae bacterium]
MAWPSGHLPALMFVALALVLLSGVPVVFGLAACGLVFAALGIQLGVMPAALLQALPLRLFGIMTNELLLAIPFFTLMGLVLDRCGLAQDLLETVALVFGPLRGGLAFAVVLVGALLGASTGVIAASVISMGLFSLPLMLRYGYDPRVATGVIAASGSLTQIVPPSLVLIVMADQLNRSVGDLYAAALVPAAMIIGGYLLLVALIAWLRPAALPALPPHAHAAREPGGASGHRSLFVLIAAGALAAWVFMQSYPDLLMRIGRGVRPLGADERAIVALAATVFSAYLMALADHALGLRWLSLLARRVTFVLMPPLFLIFLVLGTIYLGLATPTEGGALGALGALAMAAARRRLHAGPLVEAALTAVKLSCFVVFILIGSTVFTHTFNSLDGSIWVAQWFKSLPGGATGMLVIVTALVFVLGFLLDFFEIAFVLVPILAPVVEAFGIDLIWFGVLLCVNLQTSFMTPPFGYALFFLRGVAPREDSIDRESGRIVKGVSTDDIVVGALPFVAVPVLVMAALIAFPQLVLWDDGRASRLPDAAVLRILETGGSARPGAAAKPDPGKLLDELLRRER